MNAISLLKAAIALLTLVNAMGPSVPASLRAQAITISNQAIAEASAELSVQTSTGTDRDGEDQTTGGTIDVPTMPETPQLACTLEIGNEGTTYIRQQDGTTISMPSGLFQMTWDFPQGATGVLTSNAGESGTLNSNSGSRQVKTTSSVHYTLTVSQDGFDDAVCEATATHQQ